MCLPPYPPTRGSPDAWEIVCVRMSGPGHSVVACVSGRQWDSPISSLLWGQTPWFKCRLCCSVAGRCRPSKLTFRRLSCLSCKTGATTVCTANAYCENCVSN